MKATLSRWLVFFLVSCQSPPASQLTVVSTPSSTLSIDFKKSLPKLVEVPANFYSNLEIEEWKQLNRWCSQFEDLSKMNSKGMGVFLSGLEFQTRVFSNSKFPEIFDIYPVRSRLKVVQMQAQKAKFYAATEQYEKLDGALDTLYRHYNSFLNRILSIAKETPLIAEEN